jgi:protein-disulfide isomerase
METFKKDVLEPQIMSRIQKDIEDGGKIGVRGVPAVYINGRLQEDRGLKGLTDSVEKELDKAKESSRQEGE